jgi:hypothetical protein
VWQRNYQFGTAHIHIDIEFTCSLRDITFHECEVLETDEGYVVVLRHWTVDNRGDRRSLYKQEETATPPALYPAGGCWHCHVHDETMSRWRDVEDHLSAEEEQ